MKTKVIKLEHTTGVSVTLVGTCHIGTDTYYKKLIPYIGDYVLYEGLNTNKKDTKSDLMDIFEALAGILCLHLQSEYIVKSDSWINSDLSDTDLEFCGSGSLKDVEEFSSKDGKDALEVLKDKSDKVAALAPILIKSFGPLYAIKNIFNRDKAVIDLRNNKVVLDIIKHSQKTNDLTVVYGMGHLGGIVKQLKNYGFKISDSKKFDPFNF